MTEPLLRIDDLSLTLPHGAGARRILDHIKLAVFPGEVMGVVGESGSGKTMTALAIMKLLPTGAQIQGGQIWFAGADLLQKSEQELQAIRGAQIAMVFQNPRSALNPLMRAGEQVARVLRLHKSLSKATAYEEAVALLKRVGIADAAARARAYPHQLSGGMAQRVLIAIMLACQPRLLIADEPTTGLDVTIQAQIFELIKEIQRETGATLLLITHDLGVVGEMCQRVAVMYAGQIMEIAPVQELFQSPKNPYTQQLMRSILRVDRSSDFALTLILTPATDTYDIVGCRFADRCPLVYAPCWERRPAIIEVVAGHLVACHKVSKDAL